MNMTTTIAITISLKQKGRRQLSSPLFREKSKPKEIPVVHTGKTGVVMIFPYLFAFDYLQQYYSCRHILTNSPTMNHLNHNVTGN
jgi:hypothetical protein